MKIFKAIIIAVLIWVVGVTFYSISFYLPVLSDLELQGNLVLAITIIPNVWLGIHLFYRWGGDMHGLQVGPIVLLTLIFMDALFTVPFLIIPNGGSYQEFFSDFSFWCIAMECMLVIYFYWRKKIQMKMV